MIGKGLNIIRCIGECVNKLINSILDTMYWLPVSVDEIKRVCMIAILVGIVIVGIDIWLHSCYDSLLSVYVSGAYFGAIIAFASSMIGLSYFYNQFGKITENDLDVMLPVTLGISIVLAFEFGVSSFFHLETVGYGFLSCLIAIPLWVCIAMIIYFCYAFENGDVSTVLGFIFLIPIAGAIFGWEEYTLICIVIEKN